MRPIALLLAGICAAVTPVIGEECLWPSEALALPSEFASTGGVVSVRGIVSFISGLEPNRFMVVAEDHPNQRGIEVVSKIPCADLACGAVVVVSGAAVARNGAVSVDADAVDVIRVERPFPPPVAKQSDYRKGLLDGAPFEIDRALGPETGHYGLSGMRERALRNRLSLSWGVEDQWSYVQLEPEVRNG